MSKGKLKKVVDELLHPHGQEESERAAQEESEAGVAPQEGKAKADPKKDYAAHPKFAKFIKGES